MEGLMPSCYAVSRLENWKECDVVKSLNSTMLIYIRGLKEKNVKVQGSM